MAKIYLSAMFEHRDEVQGWASHMEWDGHEVVSRWHQGAPMGNDYAPTVQDWRTWAAIDFRDIDACEFFIAQMEPKGTMSRGGRHVEWGYALAKGKTCFAVGSECESQFYSVADALFPTVAEAAHAANNWEPASQPYAISEERIAAAFGVPMSVLREVHAEEGRRIQDQPAPRPSDHSGVWPLVIEDMRGRVVIGRERYGTPLQHHNGRDALVDAYQEGLDLVVYLRQAIEERNV